MNMIGKMPSLLRPFWDMVKFLGFDWLEAGIPRAKRVGHRKQKICVCEEILNFLDVGPVQSTRGVIQNNRPIKM